MSLPDSLSYQGDIEDTDFELTSIDLSRRVRHLNNSIDHFWRRWRQEYLVELREAHRFISGTSTGASIAVNDLVILHNESQTRGFWKIARVENTIVGKDGKIRGATVRVSAGDGSTKLLQRPVSLLYPLEVSCKSDSTKTNDCTDDHRSNCGEKKLTEAEPTSQRPTRAAAARAVERVKGWMNVLEEDES